MNTPQPQKEHQWLQKLAGDWTYEGEATMKPGEQPQKYSGTETVKPIGGLWIQGESIGNMPGAGSGVGLMTLGYNPEKKRFTGTYVAGMMNHLWVYEGALDEQANRLVLDTEGPDMESQGKTIKYRDVIELNNGERTMTSQALKDGRWQTFMTMHYKRRK